MRVENRFSDGHGAPIFLMKRAFNKQSRKTTFYRPSKHDQYLKK
ncbi:hypothetical protein ABID23_000648 [Bartonella silvatica]|uniref:Uncharacterized protein n=1 Tax=Bartonella silvatica TaxID=357760 RepID=A0ABV2HGA1_9HYPH